MCVLPQTKVYDNPDEYNPFIEAARDAYQSVLHEAGTDGDIGFVHHLVREDAEARLELRLEILPPTTSMVWCAALPPQCRLQRTTERSNSGDGEEDHA